jgi:hypothetical protein
MAGPGIRERRLCSRRLRHQPNGPQPLSPDFDETYNTTLSLFVVTEPSAHVMLLSGMGGCSRARRGDAR